MGSKTKIIKQESATQGWTNTGTTKEQLQAGATVKPEHQTSDSGKFRNSNGRGYHTSIQKQQATGSIMEYITVKEYLSRGLSEKPASARELQPAGNHRGRRPQGRRATNSKNKELPTPP
ncbi:hypothetical protein PIB30_031313 [Stylosanthes scabra]|uniref:Uncharacterized protein n=1 Tax=Stylosanthes scabra TaxID=79078 RepID=A0ABU6RC10_9FABA|nr:hypothetical protein [Stylosanthes scabra]